MLVSVDGLPPYAFGLRLTTKIGSDVMQDGNTADMLVMGTPGGVGFAREPPVYLGPGDTVTVTIEGIGELVNDVVDELQP